MRGVVWQAASVQRILTPTHYSLLFHIKAHVSSLRVVNHTKLKQHGGIDFFAGKEADMVLEKERSSLFYVCGSEDG